MTSPLYMLVTGTSAVGIRKKSLFFTLKASSSNFGNCPVPVLLALFTINGGNISVYPLAVCVSSIKLYIERSSLAPKPLYTVNLAPLIFAAVCGSRILREAPRSQCGLSSKSATLGSPTLRTSTLSLSSLPIGTLLSGTLGIESTASLSAGSISARAASNSLISSPSSFISAIIAEASPLFLFITAISSLTLFRVAFFVSTSIKISLRLA